LNKLGTKYGLLKGWFSSECLKKSTTQFLTIVDKNVEFLMREMTKKISGGKDFCLVRIRQKLLANQVGVHVLKIICYVTVDVIINRHVKINKCLNQSINYFVKI